MQPLRLAPKHVRPLLDVTAEARERAPLIVVARYLSEGTRQRLRDGGVGYLDLTGNVQIAVSEPGLYIETQGASEHPDREERPARSLRGAKAGRIVRALIDRRQPPGVRELAALTNNDAGYVSRVLALLDSEALITRVGRGRAETPRSARREEARRAPVDHLISLQWLAAAFPSAARASSLRAWCSAQLGLLARTPLARHEQSAELAPAALRTLGNKQIESSALSWCDSGNTGGAPPQSRAPSSLAIVQCAIAPLDRAR